MTLAENPQQLSSGNKKSLFQTLSNHFNTSNKALYIKALFIHLISNLLYPFLNYDGIFDKQLKKNSTFLIYFHNSKLFSVTSKFVFKNGVINF